ncbi:MAG: VCBS repeat-containing protein, partial [Ignavibacteriae bacterium]|nr:VCBS repeat-containing protein [Ignavibacteriota bacterium]
AATGIVSLYQWQKDSLLIVGATNASYTTPATTSSDSGGLYKCILANPAGSVTSNAALLHVLPSPPSITQQPSNKNALVGDSIAFVIEAAGTSPLCFQWQCNEISIPGATSRTHAISSASVIDSGSCFRCVVSNNIGTVTSSQALLRVSNGAPLITLQPQNQIVFAGQNARFAVSAIGLHPFNFRWQRDAAPIVSASDSVLTISATTCADSGAVFDCIVSNSLGSAASNVAMLIVNGGIPIVTEQPRGRALAPGQRLRVSVTAVGTQPMTFQWRKNEIDIGGATSSQYDTPALTTLDNGSTYQCRISNGVGTTLSNVANASVVTPLDLSAHVPFRYVLIDANNPRHPHTTAVGDIDGDGYVDVTNASADGYTDGLYWYRYPTWQKCAVDTGSFPGDRQIGDIDGDGDNDLVALRGFDSGISLWWYENPRPLGDPMSAPWQRRMIDVLPSHDVELADLNCDGRLDIIVRRDTLVVLFQKPAATWQKVKISSRPKDGSGIGDLDGDGDLDIAINGYWLESPLPSGDPETTPWVEHLVASGWPAQVGVRVDDVNGDGRNDIILSPSGSYSGRLSWYECNPTTGSWSEHVIDTATDALHTFKTGDFDRDGDLDVITGEGHWGNDPDDIILWLNSGAGLIWSEERIATTGIHNLRIADFGNDDDIDLVGSNSHDIVNSHGSPLEMWENLLGSRLSSPTSGLQKSPAIPSTTRSQNSHIPTEFALRQNYPNPFNPQTTIAYSVPQEVMVALRVFDVLGREVARLVDEVKGAGEYAVRWNALPVASGIYFCRLRAGDFTDLKKMIVVR